VAAEGAARKGQKVRGAADARSQPNWWQMINPIVRQIENLTPTTEVTDYKRIALGFLGNPWRRVASGSGKPETRRTRLHRRIEQETRDVELDTFEDGWQTPENRYPWINR
jgi:hypothetical protein